MKENLEYLFCPKSVAVIGVSRKSESVGQSVFRNIIKNKFKGKVFGVNPKAKRILGKVCYSNILDIPEEIDLAVIVVKAGIVSRVLLECAQKRVKGVIVISAGFREIGERGLGLEEEIKKIVKENQIQLVGPNCLGLINTDPKISLNASFTRTQPLKGNISFITQSGAICTAVLDYAKAESIGFSKFISIGNKADIDENDLLDYLKDDPQTDVILMYLEDLSDEREFIRIAREITGEIPKRKPIIVVKSGRTLAGKRAATSHTGALIGSDEVVDGIFTQCGVLRVDSVAELFESAITFANQPLLKGNRIAIITNAGGPGVMATDACIRKGLKMAKFSQSTLSKLKGALPKQASVNNPVDLIGDAQEDRYQVSLDLVLKDKNVDGLICILTPQAMTNIEEIAKTICKISSKYAKPVLGCFMGIADVSKGERILREGKIPHYRFPEVAAQALANMNDYLNWVRRPRTEVKLFKVERMRAEEIINKAREKKRKFLNEFEATQVLASYGFPVLKCRLVKNVEELKGINREIGFPVAIKISSPDIIHKVDVGGVRLNIEDEFQLKSAFSEIIEKIKRFKPKARIEGILVQEMAEKGKEVILGLKRDPHFGPVLMFGLGGIYVEAFKDITFRLAPIRTLSAKKMIESTKAYSILKGIRGEIPSDIEAVQECLERLSQLSMELSSIQEIDINPLVVYEEKKGCKVVHTRIIIS